MDPFPHCFNTYNNIGNRQRAATFQPTDKSYIMQKYFDLQQINQQVQTNYANVADHPDTLPLFLPTPTNHIIPNNHHQRQVSRHSHHSRSHLQHAHSRSHSQHYYQTMHHHHQYHHHPSAQDPNFYYNLTGGPLHQTPITRSRHSPIDEPPISNPRHLDSITVMQVCNELGNTVDSDPPMPNTRKYSVVDASDGSFIKLAFPHSRMMRKDFKDPRTRLLLTAGEPILVKGPSEDDRSKFTVTYRGHSIDIPHQYTQVPPIPLRLNLPHH